MPRLSVEDSESDSFRPRYFSIHSLRLGIGIKVPKYSTLKRRKWQYLWLFEGKKGKSDSKFRDSRFRTRNRSRNRNRYFTMQGLGLGIGLVIMTYKVSDSESGLENRDSGNSAGKPENSFHQNLALA